MKHNYSIWQRIKYTVYILIFALFGPTMFLAAEKRLFIGISIAIAILCATQMYKLYRSYPSMIERVLHTRLLNIFALTACVLGMSASLAMHSYVYGNTGLASLSVAGLLLALGGMWVALYKWDLERHPLVRQLTKRSRNRLRHLREQMEVDGSVLYGNVALTPASILHVSAFWVNPIDRGDLMWAHGASQEQRVNGFKVSTVFSLVLNFHDQDALKINMREEEVARALQFIERVYPWAVIGYSEDISRGWNEENTSFVNYVKARQAMSAPTH